MISDLEKDVIKKKFTALDNYVELAIFTQELECQFCKETRDIVLELGALSPKIKTKVYDFVKNDRIPASCAEVQRDELTACSY